MNRYIISFLWLRNKGMWAHAFTFKHFNSPNGPIRFCLPQPIFCRWEPWPLMYGAMGFMPGLWKVVDIWTFKSNSRDTENWAPMPTCVVMDFGLSSPSGHTVINLGPLNLFYHLWTNELGPHCFSKNTKTFGPKADNV